jgi:diaminohydroxyphosphoribosylaminopyrimidine deaminase / 5-amino-6-(5-phosphoribosylamino)uracil reductase
MNTNINDEHYMQMALKLAGRGIGKVEPNPPVGCVIVKSVQVIGKGWHKQFGGPHAEINAIEDCTTLGASPAGATMYVTLEPCCHQGQTGPCSDAIIKAGVSRVVIAVEDPSEKAGGKGIDQLRKAGVEVEVGLCQDKGQQLIAAFAKYATTNLPWVILKWAQTIDGKLAFAESDDKQRWISNESSRKDVHNLRRSVQGVLVGINTVIADNPQLTPRPAKGRKTAGIVLDSALRIPLGCKLLGSAGSRDVFVVTTHAAGQEQADKVERISRKGAKVICVSSADSGCDLGETLYQLGKAGIAGLLIEGGPKVLAAFLKARLADEVIVYMAPMLLGGAGAAGISDAMAVLDNPINLKSIEVKEFDGDIRLMGVIKKETLS